MTENELRRTLFEQLLMLSPFCRGSHVRGKPAFSSPLFLMNFRFLQEMEHLYEKISRFGGKYRSWERPDGLQ